MFPAGFYASLKALLDRFDIPLIADEVVTAFGRTGEWFGVRHDGVKPDVMCIAKAITSGYFPLGACVVNEKIESAFKANKDALGTIYHGYCVFDTLYGVDSNYRPHPQMAEGHSVKGILLLAYGLLFIGNIDNVLRLIINKRIGNTHPIITVIGVFIGIPLFGILGLVFGPLLLSYFLLLLEIYETNRLAADRLERIRTGPET